jgi:YD repeat-containing protein
MDRRRREGTGKIAGRIALTLLTVVVSALSLNGQGAGAIQYFYDDLGRLTRVVDPSGNIATYHYDAVGNLLSITRSSLPANNGLAILNLTSQSGPVGQAVAQ